MAEFSIITLDYSQHSRLLAFAKSIGMESCYRLNWFSSPKDYERGHVWAATNDAGDIIAGMLVNHGIRRKSTKINHIDVLPEYRGRGVGTALIRELSLTSPWNWLELKCAQDNTGAHRFYERLGFTVWDSDSEHRYYSLNIRDKS